MINNLAQWVRFTWNLEALPIAELQLPQPYSICPITKESHDEVAKVITDSLALEPSWNEAFRELRPYILNRVALAFEKSEIPCIAIGHGSRLIGVSVMDPDSSTGQHLIAGPCVYSEYRNRGLGAYLLDQSLRYQKALGLKEASGCTKQIAPAAKFVYSKFKHKTSTFDLDAVLATAVAKV
jgi:hypothetical protein